MGRLFGTDGIRGIAGETLTCELAIQIGSAAAEVLSGLRRRPLFVIGKDTRMSSDMLECAIGRRTLFRRCRRHFCRRRTDARRGISCRQI